jgi:hypothetical protein
MLYSSGRGVRQNFKQAVNWFRQSAEQGDALAQFHLGKMHADGTGVPQDYKLAEYWYRKSATQGYAAAQFELGQCFLNGGCGKRDEKAALTWLDQAVGNAVDAISREKYAVLRDQTAEQIASRPPAPTAAIDEQWPEPAQSAETAASDEQLVLSHPESNVDKMTEPVAEIKQALSPDARTADTTKSADQLVLPEPAETVQDQSSLKGERPAQPAVEEVEHEASRTVEKAHVSELEMQTNVPQEDEHSADSVNDDMSVEPVQDELANFAIESEPGVEESGPSGDTSAKDHADKELEDHPPSNSTEDTEQIKDEL